MSCDREKGAGPGRGEWEPRTHPWNQYNCFHSFWASEACVPQSILAPKYSFPLSQESPKDELLSPDLQSPGQEDPELR